MREIYVKISDNVLKSYPFMLDQVEVKTVSFHFWFSISKNLVLFTNDLYMNDI